MLPKQKQHVADEGEMTEGVQSHCRRAAGMYQNSTRLLQAEEAVGRCSLMLYCRERARHSTQSIKSALHPIALTSFGLKPVLGGLCQIAASWWETPAVV